MTEESKLEKLLPAMDAMMLAELKMQQLRGRPYYEVRKPMQELTEEFLSASNEFIKRAMELEIVDPKIIKQ